MNSAERATFGGGCFWCLEAVFKEVRGVSSVVSGYMGGQRPNPTYEQVCAGATGHAEVVQTDFDPSAISYRDLLEVFFAIHDPTTLNRQGNDVGTQYRSVIFTHSDEQANAAKQAIAALSISKDVVTEVADVEEFYPAEAYHQNYFANHANAPYCLFVVWPKLEKFRKSFPEMKT